MYLYMRLQVYEGKGSRYSSVISGLTGIVRHEGFTALYKVTLVQVHTDLKFRELI